jgi:hypothetical protein
MVNERNFELRESPLPEPAEGQALVRNLFVSFDPAMRGWIEDRPSYVPPVAIGEVMRAQGVAQVLESRHPDLSPGDFVTGTFGWQDYALGGGRGPLGGLAPVPKDVPLSWPLGVLGGTGLTAYFGVLDVGEVARGETVVVSGAAGATGSVASQIARIQGASVIGIAGGERKCAWLREQARLDGVIDYKSEDVGARLTALCPKGIDVYFDNVGGELLDQVLARIAEGARIALCGAISGYNDPAGPRPPRNYLNLILRRARMEGFLVLDYVARFAEAQQQLLDWVREEQIAHAEDVQQGLENAPRTFLRLFRGENLGKQLLKIADPPLDG